MAMAIMNIEVGLQFLFSPQLALPLTCIFFFLPLLNTSAEFGNTSLISTPASSFFATSSW